MNRTPWICLALVMACGSVTRSTDTPDAAAPPFGRLWVPQHNQSQVRAWNASRLDADGDGPADIVLSLDTACKPNALAFDGAGHLWITCNGSSQLLRIAAGDLGASGTPTPAVVLDSDGTSLVEPIGLAFDGAGNLWVACADRLELFAPANLQNSGPTTPDRVITSAGLDVPASLIFDGAGNLWLANASFTPATNSVMAFTPAQLAAGGAQTPRLTITSPDFALVEGLAFDPEGNLWVSSNDGGLARFDAAEVALPAAEQSVSKLPAFQLEESADARTVRDAGGLALDSAGDLWVTSQLGDAVGDDARVLRFTAAQLGGLTDDTPLAATVVVGNAASSPGLGGLAIR